MTDPNRRTTPADLDRHLDTLLDGVEPEDTVNLVANQAYYAATADPAGVDHGLEMTCWLFATAILRLADQRRAAAGLTAERYPENGR